MSDYIGLVNQQVATFKGQLEQCQAELARVKQECAEPQKEIKRIRESYARHFAAAKEAGARSAFEFLVVSGDFFPEASHKTIDEFMAEWRKREQFKKETE